MKPHRPIRVRSARCCAALAFLVAALSLHGQVQIVTHNEGPNFQCVASAPFQVKPGWAFLPVELEMSNPTKQPQRWVFSTQHHSYGGNAMSVASRLSVVAEPGAKSRSGGVVVLGGSGGGYGYNMARLARAGGGSSNSSTNLNTDSGRSNERLLLATPSMRLRGGSSHQIVETTRMPSDWRAYRGFDRIALTDDDWRSLAPGARTALRQWLRLGGSLFVAEWDGGALDGLPAAEAGDDGAACSFGHIERVPALGEVGKRLGEVGKRLDQMDAEDGAARPWSASAVDGTALSDWPAAMTRMEGGSGRGVSWVMAVVVLGFAILAGPVNIFLLAPARRRHRLFFTTPVISLAAGAMMVVAVVLVDGIGGKGDRVVWLESVPDDNTAYVQQHQVSRCGAMFSTGFEIPEAAYFEPLQRRRDSFSGSFEVDVLADRVTAGGPWFSSRRAQAFYLAAARPGRGRVELGGAPERPVLTSAFDFPMERCFFLAADGRTWWQCAALKPGTDTPMAPATAAEVRAALESATRDAPSGYRSFTARAMSRPGYFVALAAAVPAIETHRRIKWQTTGIITGPAVTP